MDQQNEICEILKERYIRKRAFTFSCYPKITTRENFIIFLICVPQRRTEKIARKTKSCRIKINCRWSKPCKWFFLFWSLIILRTFLIGLYDSQSYSQFYLFWESTKATSLCFYFFFLLVLCRRYYAFKSDLSKWFRKWLTHETPKLPSYRFREEINWLVSIWWQFWRLLNELRWNLYCNGINNYHHWYEVFLAFHRLSWKCVVFFTICI